MRFEEPLWDEENERHIAKHNVTEEEVEDVVRGSSIESVQDREENGLPAVHRPRHHVARSLSLRCSRLSRPRHLPTSDSTRHG